MVTSTLCLSHFLADLAEHDLCFCCDSPTDLVVGADGRLLVRCPSCGAEIQAS